MLIYATALAIEAAPIVRRLDLALKESRGGFRIYGGKEKKYPSGGVFLTVTGTGLLQSSAAAAYVLGRLGAGAGDVLVNFGMAGASAASPLVRGDAVLPVKFTREGERDLYPDILFPAGMLPANIRKGIAVTVTGAAKAEGGRKEKTDSAAAARFPAELPAVYDNEAYGLIRTAGMILGTQGALSVKVVSDFIGDTAGSGGVISKDGAAAVIEAAADSAIAFSEAYHSFISGKFAENAAQKDLPPDLLGTWENISRCLSLSFARAELLKNLMRRDCYAGTDARSKYAEIAAEAAAFRGDKKAGLEFFEAFLAGSEYI